LVRRRAPHRMVLLDASPRSREQTQASPPSPPRPSICLQFQLKAVQTPSRWIQDEVYILSLAGALFWGSLELVVELKTIVIPPCCRTSRFLIASARAIRSNFYFYPVPPPSSYCVFTSRIFGHHLDPEACLFSRVSL